MTLSQWLSVYLSLNLLILLLVPGLKLLFSLNLGRAVSFKDQLTINYFALFFLVSIVAAQPHSTRKSFLPAQQVSRFWWSAT